MQPVHGGVTRHEHESHVMSALKQSSGDLRRASRTTFGILESIRREQGLRQAIDFARVALRCALRGQMLPHTVDIHRTLWSNYDWSGGGA